MNKIHTTTLRDYETTEEMISAAELFLNNGRLDFSETLAREALRNDQTNSDAIAVLGILAYKTGNLQQAQKILFKATEISPGNALHHFRLGNIYHDLGSLDAAINSYRESIKIDPDFSGALVNLSNALLAQKKYTQAEEYALRAIENRPQSAEAYSNLGQTYMKQGRLADAHHELKRAVTLEPHRFDLQNNLGVLQQLSGHVDDAIATFQSILKTDPHARLAERNLKIAVLNSPSWDTNAIFKLNKEAGNRLKKNNICEVKSHDHDFSTARKLRIAYISSDFHEHPVGNNILPLLKHHNKDDLEIYLYSNVETPDQKTKIFKQFADQWSETSPMTDVQLARQIAEDRIDIAVYLAGRFNLNRVEIAAYRPAPVQVSFHDCATTGLDSMDYWLTDGLLHPEETDEKFTEELFRLPVFYQFTLPDPIPDITPTPYLENGYVTFGSFSKPEKISEEVVSVWGNVLKNTENSKLLLKFRNLYSDEAMKSIWRRRFEVEGIDQERILFITGEHTQPEHLAHYNRVDIALDPFPFNGATTTFEAMLMGVPVISLEGTHFVGRVGATLLRQGDLPEFIAKNSEDYAKKATLLASSLASNPELRGFIRQNLLASSLFNAESYTKSVEKSYWEMWHRKCAQHP